MAVNCENKQQELNKISELTSITNPFSTLSKVSFNSQDNLKQVKSERVINILSKINKNVSERIQENQMKADGKISYLDMDK